MALKKYLQSYCHCCFKSSPPSHQVFDRPMPSSQTIPQSPHLNKSIQSPVVLIPNHSPISRVPLSPHLNNIIPAPESPIPTLPAQPTPPRKPSPKPSPKPSSQPAQSITPSSNHKSNPSPPSPI